MLLIREELFETVFLALIHLWPVDGQDIFVSLEVPTHILRVHDLSVKFAAKWADEHMQPEEETAHRGQFFIIFVRERAGNLLTG